MIKGFGGGGGGGGSARVPIEASDTLRSQQFANLVDLLSEGEIEGIEGGLRGIFLDGTPLQNSDGTFNFSGVVVETRNGTQAQSALNEFDSVQAEKAVGVEVKNSAPVVRQITDPSVDKAKVTISLPSLSKTDQTTGDTKGSSVTIAIDLQVDGGGFYPLTLSRATENVPYNLISNIYTCTIGGDDISVDVEWVGVSSTETQVVNYTLSGRLQGGSTWTVIKSGVFSGNGVVVPRYGTLGYFENDLSSLYYTTKPTQKHEIPTGLSGLMEFKVEYTSNSEVTSVGVSRVSRWVLKQEDTITGKASTKYQKDYWVDLPGDGPWDIRVRRITADSSTQYLQDKTYWESYAEVINTKLRYPNTALVGVSVDAAQFSNVPSRAYLTKGVKIKVPTNYDPLLRTYTGLWDGSFKVAWSDNPAWVFYDLVTNTRYGLGSFIDVEAVDIGTLYQIAQYCDELVPDGYGGVEPRYTCNLYLQSKEEAFHVLGNISSIFSGMVYWGGGLVTISADMPSDPVWLFTNANVFEGNFEYSGSAISARHTVALVAWNDPQDKYKQKIEYVEDRESVTQFGVRETEVVAIGATSRGQAHRLGKRILLTEKMLTDTVSFSAGLEATKCFPGAVIGIQDNFRSGQRLGGRVVSSTTSNVTIDSPFSFQVGESYTISIMLPDGSLEERAVSNPSGTSTVVTVFNPFTSAPGKNAIWVIASGTVETQLFKVLSIRESGDLKWDITALEYNYSKYAAIDENAQFEPIVYSSDPSIIDPPEGVVISEELFRSSVGRIENRLTIAWNSVQSIHFSHYLVSWRYKDGNWSTLPETKNTQVSVDFVFPSDIEVSVKAVNSVGVASPPVYKTATLLGKTAPPADVVNFLSKTVNQTTYLTWNPSDDLDISHYTLRFSPNISGVNWGASSLLVQKVSHPTTSISVPAMNGSYLIKAVDDSGNESINATLIVANVSEINKYNVVEVITESPTFDGVKVNTVLDGAFLRLNNSLDGYYYFQNSVDLGAIYTSRVFSRMSAYGLNLKGTMDTWTSLSSINPLSGANVGSWSSVVQVRTTDDDPSGTPAWSSWSELTIGEYTCRSFEFRVHFMSTDPDVTPAVSGVELTVDMPDRVDGGDDLVCGVGGYTVTYSKQFKNNPAVGIAAQDLTTGDYYVISAKSSIGFTIQFYNSSNVPVQRIFDWVAKGYGYGL